MRRRFAVLIRCFALTMLGAQAFADPTLRHFDIQTQATPSALNAFARQADITLVFASALVDRHQMVGIKGDFTVLEALKKLLEGTGLSFTQVAQRRSPSAQRPRRSKRLRRQMGEAPCPTRTVTETKRRGRAI